MLVSLEKTESSRVKTNEVSIQVDQSGRLLEKNRKIKEKKAYQFLSNKVLKFTRASVVKSLEPRSRKHIGLEKKKNKQFKYVNYHRTKDFSLKRLEKNFGSSLSNTKLVSENSSSQIKTKKILIKKPESYDNKVLRQSKSCPKKIESDPIQLSVYDPLSNFATDVIPHSSYVQPKPKIYRVHFFNKKRPASGQTVKRVETSTPVNSNLLSEESFHSLSVKNSLKFNFLNYKYS